ncbi:hypothetical protein LCGC14_1117430 [marine sediment metagenome]|uniref:Uncharacterized protein n=1 Tax=marine sediment metagenome TaxID=412755 RepID=A0A0F9PN32_9ZZZZ
MKARYEIGRIHGKKYKLEYDQFKNQQACCYTIEDNWAWFLWVDGEYVGNFNDKQIALLSV